LEQALVDLRLEYESRGRLRVFEHLQDYLAWNSGDARLEELGRALDMTAGALRVAIYRLRQRYREMVEEQLANTVGSPDGVEEELRELRRVLGG
jgi:RNA polymerase sigma-70 factor (ECF subfamily)